jgi:hypothetical protein
VTPGITPGDSGESPYSALLRDGKLPRGSLVKIQFVAAEEQVVDSALVADTTIKP